VIGSLNNDSQIEIAALIVAWMAAEFGLFMIELSNVG